MHLKMMKLNLSHHLYYRTRGLKVNSGCLEGKKMPEILDDYDRTYK